MSLYGTILDLSLALYGLRVWWCPSFTCYPALEAFKNLSERNWQPTGMLTVSQFTLGGCPFIGYREWEVVSHTLCQVSLHDSMVSVFFLNLPKKERDQTMVFHVAGFACAKEKLSRNHVDLPSVHQSCMK
ncbi:hypothetical protein NC653_001290 [Populus alba x Populus x berolinensis]|uniref:Uncharacterized protein n=1 Tax=Populus alba x Populus x berolinensis TaxID=444605 RepID=A0AAD6RLX5_9ROSI|nr:hypothetical protein NC653_001290 [Populus alba x Populus x berolinensis]